MTDPTFAAELQAWMSRSGGAHLRRSGLTGPTFAAELQACMSRSGGAHLRRSGLTGPTFAAELQACMSRSGGAQLRRSGMAGPTFAAEVQAGMSRSAGAPLRRSGMMGPTFATELQAWMSRSGEAHLRRSGLPGPTFAAELQASMKIAGVGQSGLRAAFSASPPAATTLGGPGLRAPRSLENRGLLRTIRLVHAESGGSYGAPRVHAAWRAAGHGVGRHRIGPADAPLLALALAAIPRKIRTTDSRRDHPIAPDRLRRSFTATAPNQISLSSKAALSPVGQWARRSDLCENRGRLALPCRDHRSVHSQGRRLEPA